MTATTAPVRLAPGRWTTDPGRTEASFRVGNLGRTVRGTVQVTSGELDVDDAGRPVAVRAVLDLGTVATGHPRRDADLRRPGLLDAEGHPAMTFECGAVRVVPGGWCADGRLGLRGTTCPLPVTGGVQDDSTADRVHVVGTATLDRTAAGIRAPRLLIGRTVTVTVDAWLTPPGRVSGGSATPAAS
ncbi:YceI family protein [Modestobacter versicolor]|uniref:YceI family protein n=1 Tax=Modestobacter versicolor TaxID=429133 RepID=UPI0034DEC072